MNELALFAGAGGGILGGKLLGWRTVCAVEWEPYAACVLAARQNDGLLPPFPIWDDIQTFDGRPWRGIVDVVSGGFPCQDISVAGKGDGLDGERSGMWKHMARVVGEVRPRFVFVENSPMLTSRGGTRVIADLATLGYDTRWTVMGAADVGAPHQRDRFWLVAHAHSVRFDSGKHDAEKRGHDALRQVWQGEEGSAGRQDGIYGVGAACGARCDYCERFFAKYRCNAPDECDCPRCQGYCECNVAHADSAQRQGNECPQRIGKKHSDIGSSSWWQSEPNVGRVAHGVAARVDRLKAIGNGQVPLCAATAWRELIGR